MSQVKRKDAGPTFTDWNGVLAELFDLETMYTTGDTQQDSSSGVASDIANYTTSDITHYPTSSGYQSSHTGSSDCPCGSRPGSSDWYSGSCAPGGKNLHLRDNMCQYLRDDPSSKSKLRQRISPVSASIYDYDGLDPYNISGVALTPPGGNNRLPTPDPLQDKEKLLHHSAKHKTRFCYFDIVPDDVIIQIFSSLSSDQLCRCAGVCRRWYHLVWDISLWTSIEIHNSDIDVDKALKVLTKRLSMDTPTVCVMVEKIDLSYCEQLTDRGLHVIAKRCPELRQLVLQGCPHITNIALFEVVSRCVSLEHLNVAGSACISCICLTPEATVQASTYGKQVYLRYLDLSDCPALDDAGLQLAAAFCQQLTYLYLRRCSRLTDIGVQYVATYCTCLRELSITDCHRVTDFGVRELARLESNLRYLSVAKCDKISDLGMKHVIRHCRKIRYLNMRGCEAVSDETVERVAQCCKRLKSLDIGKCDVTDAGLKVLAENCPQVKKLSLKGCEGVTDQGVMMLAYCCRSLQQLNIQDCHLSVDAYRTVRKYCKRCIIEHTNPAFF